MPFSPMEYGLGYLTGPKETMQSFQGSLFTDDANPELERKTKKVTEKLAENLHTVTNGPSLALFRIQEHARQSLPVLIDKKRAVQSIQQEVQGRCFDMEYAINAVQSMQKSSIHFGNMQELLRNATFMAQQINYEQNRHAQERSQPSMYRAAGMVRTQTVDIPYSTSPSQHAPQVSPRTRSSSLHFVSHSKSPTPSTQHVEK